MSNGQRFFEDFKVGDGFESPSKTLTDAHFLFFSGLTGDAHPLHYDVEYAKTTRFRAPAFIGDTIKPDHEVIALERKRSAGLLTLRVTLTNQRGETVLEGDHRYLIAYRPV